MGGIAPLFQQSFSPYSITSTSLESPLVYNLRKIRPSTLSHLHIPIPKQLAEGIHSKQTSKLFQVCRNNSNSDVCITGCTIFSFKPDLAKFNITELEDDFVTLMKKRVVDWAGILGKSGNVELDGKCVSVNSFTDYVSLYLQAESKSKQGSLPFPSIAKKFGDRWEICVSRSDRRLQQQVSFVNGFATIKGCTHVDYVTNQISNHLMAVANQQKEKPIIINADTIKKYLWVFVNCLIDEPAFDSPTKESLVTPPESFGSKCELSLEFLIEVEKSWLVYHILQWESFRQREPMKKNDKVEKPRVTGSKCLVDAKEAFEKQRVTGTDRHKCTLILTVGDLAESFTSRGICCGGHYGLFFLSNHLLSSEDRFDQLYERNGDIQATKGVLGLEEGKQYQSAETLRYRHLMIMADTGKYLTKSQTQRSHLLSALDWLWARNRARSIHINFDLDASSNSLIYLSALGFEEQSKIHPYKL